MYDNAPASIYLPAVYEHAVSKFTDQPERLDFCVIGILGYLCGCGSGKMDSKTCRSKKKPPDSLSEMYSGHTEEYGVGNT